MASESRTQIELGNGSRVVSLPNNPDAIRGYRADHVYVDEAAMFRNDFEVKAAVIPCIVGRKGRLSLVSTPKGRRGWSYEPGAPASSQSTRPTTASRHTYRARISKAWRQASRTSSGSRRWRWSS